MILIKKCVLGLRSSAVEYHAYREVPGSHPGISKVSFGPRLGRLTVGRRNFATYFKLYHANFMIYYVKGNSNGLFKILNLSSTLS